MLLLTGNAIINNYYKLNNYDIQNIQGRGRGYQPKAKAEVDNPYRDNFSLLSNEQSDEPNI